MRRTELMTAAGATLAGLGVLVGVAIGSAGNGAKTVAQRIPPVEVRTEIVRKTVNVYRKAKPHHVAAAGAGTGAAASSVAAGTVGAPPATRSSGARAVAAPVVATRSSGARPSSGTPAVRTHSSGGGAGSGSRVSTRSSGGGEHERGGHDD